MASIAYVDASKAFRVMQTAAKQAVFAARGSVGEVARAASVKMGEQAGRDLDRPTPFTRRGFYSQGAGRTKGDFAVVGIKAKQAEYLRYQVKGGIRRPRNIAIQTPGKSGKLNEFGNIPKTAVKALIRRAKANRSPTKAQRRKYRVAKSSIFYGDPQDGRSVGLYQRIPGGGPNGGKLVSLVRFPKTPAQYKPRLKFGPTVRLVVRREFRGIYARRLARALQTAR